MIRPVPGRGFTLVELVIVISVMGVLLAAGFLLFETAGRSAGRVSESATSILDARAAADALESSLLTAGYRTDPSGSESHPVTVALESGIVFTGRSRAGAGCTFEVRSRQDGGFVISQEGDEVYASPESLGVRFSYFDGNGGPLSPGDLATQAGCDMIRRIDFSICAPGAGAIPVISSGCTPPNLQFPGL